MFFHFTKWFFVDFEQRVGEWEREREGEGESDSVSERVSGRVDYDQAQ